MFAFRVVIVEKISILRYVENLEQVVIDLLSSSYNLHGFRSPHTGVWVKTRGPHQMSKICALGVRNAQSEAEKELNALQVY